MIRIVLQFLYEDDINSREDAPLPNFGSPAQQRKFLITLWTESLVSGNLNFRSMISVLMTCLKEK
jgi:hypothetical protein